MKKALLFLSIFCACLFSSKAQSPDSTIAASDIQYWIGNGSNEVVFIVSWDESNVAFAWGYRFNDDAMLVMDLMDSIAAADSRFSYDGDGGTVSDLYYQDAQYDLSMNGDFPMYIINGLTAQLGYASQEVVDGDIIKWGSYMTATFADDWSWMAWTTPVTPVSDPNPQPQNVDATIAASDIQYWIGSGNNEAIFIGNWCNEPNAYAWGYRFDADSVTVATMLSDICNADLRLSFSESGGFLTDLVFLHGQDSLAIAPDYIVYNHNGQYADIVSNEYIHNGDYIKMGGYGCADMDENWVSTWTTPVVAVADPVGIQEHINRNLTVYPNPCVNTLTVGTTAGGNVTLFNAQGAVVMSTLATSDHTTLNVQSLSAGVYFIKHEGNISKVIKK